MTWRPIRRNEGGEGMPSIRAGSNSRKGNAYAQMFLTLSVSLARHIGVREGDRVKVDLGVLGDVGWARISRGDEQKATRFGHKGSIRVRFSGRWLGIKETNRPTDVKYHSDGKTIKFLLPTWARQNEVK